MSNIHTYSIKHSYHRSSFYCQCERQLSVSLSLVQHSSLFTPLVHYSLLYSTEMYEELPKNFTKQPITTKFTSQSTRKSRNINSSSAFDHPVTGEWKRSSYPSSWRQRKLTLSFPPIINFTWRSWFVTENTVSRYFQSLITFIHFSTLNWKYKDKS